MINLSFEHKLNLQILFAFACAFAVYAMPEAAHALSLNNTVGRGICELVAMGTGRVGKSIATLGIMFLGIGSFFGKTSWGLILTVTAGIAVIFGANEIAETLVSSGSWSACSGISVTNNFDNRIGSGLCAVANALNGRVGRSIATLAIVFVALSAFFGKASWAAVITTSAGIAALFGATAIVQGIMGSGFTVDCLPPL